MIPKTQWIIPRINCLERARSLGFRVLAITLHDAVFDRKEVFADAAAMGILLIPAAEMRLQGADVIVLNVSAEEMAQLKSFDDLRRLRARRGDSIFTIAPHPFYVVRRLDRIAIISRDRLLRRDRVLSFSRRPLQSKSPCKKSGVAFWQTIDRHLRRASAPRFWPPLYEHPHALCADSRECFCSLAQWPTAPNESCVAVSPIL